MLYLRTAAQAHVKAFDYRRAGGRDNPHAAKSRGCFSVGELEQRPLLEDPPDLLRALYGDNLRGSLQQPHLSLNLPGAWVHDEEVAMTCPFAESQVT